MDFLRFEEGNWRNAGLNLARLEEDAGPRSAHEWVGAMRCSSSYAFDSCSVEERSGRKESRWKEGRKEGRQRRCAKERTEGRVSYPSTRLLFASRSRPRCGFSRQNWPQDARGARRDARARLGRCILAAHEIDLPYRPLPGTDSRAAPSGRVLFDATRFARPNVDAPLSERASLFRAASPKAPLAIPDLPLLPYSSAEAHAGGR
ncbi:hypothetical protein KM043_006089 [Ampulex compressa]|nr:hypothetical protein KM043_006089 [Ampulex compressa]